MSRIKLNHIHDISAENVKDSELAFLMSLGGPSVLHIQGRDNSRCRVIVTLLHGNEPSGLKAIHSLIKQSVVPATALKIIIASVMAALTEPVFTHRMLLGQRDLNRCFSDSAMDLQGHLASAIAQQIEELAPEAVVDIHNTSGSGPAFCVSVSRQAEHVALSSIFARRLIVTDIRLGSIMEQSFGCPVITFEAGGAQDKEADQNAFEGICAFATSDNLFNHMSKVELLHHPRRFEIKHASSLTFANGPDPKRDITICPNVENLNFGITPASYLLGWVNENNGLEHFQLDDRRYQVNRFFRLENGQLLTNRAMKLFMVTTRADIAKSDCLFYFVVADQ